MSRPNRLLEEEENRDAFAIFVLVIFLIFAAVIALRGPTPGTVDASAAISDGGLE